MSYLFNHLYDMKYEVGQNGQPFPLVLDLMPDAKSLLIEYYNEEQNNQSSELAAAWAKLLEYPRRLALVIHCVRVAVGDPLVETPKQVDAKSMEVGIKLTQWFKLEASRLYPSFPHPKRRGFV